MKKKSIVKKNIIRLIILAVFILIGTCLVAGFVFYKKLLKDNVELAYSFAGIATLEASGDLIDEINDNADHLQEVYKSVFDSPSNEIKDLAPEDQKLLQQWTGMDTFLFSAVYSNSNLRTFQIIYPENNEAVCIWYIQKDSNESFIPMSRRPLRPAEVREIEAKRQIDDEYRANLTIDRIGNEIVGTAIYPVWNSDLETVAYAEVDLSLTGVRLAILYQTLAIAGIIVIILAAALFGYYFFLRREMLRPILQLEAATTDVVDKLKNGDQTFDLHIHTGDELESLSHSFENMESNLREYINENARITSERERVNAELTLAANIQSDMLPASFPVFPERKEFDIYAMMKPAKEVGGDFYDFFLIDENTLALVIADVSGKGIPASLFMMRSMLMIQNLAAGSGSPAEILENVNNQICRNNESDMFVTIWLGILDIRAGILKAANAGHEYPILRVPGGRFDIYRDPHGFVAGGVEDASYKEYELALTPGSILFVYSDGVVEAKNAENDMFGTRGLVKALNQSADESPGGLIRTVTDNVMEFVKDEEQFDDSTMLCIRYNGAGKKDPEA